MARKTSASAEKDRQKRDFNTWRLLVRNPAFLKDLASLTNREDRESVTGASPVTEPKQIILKRMQEIEAIADKWGLSRFPSRALLPDVGNDPQTLEWCYLSQGDKQGPYPLTYPIVAFTELKENRFVHLWVDTSQPADTILAAFEKELREFYKANGTKRKRGRPDDLDFQLKVFDLVEGSADTPAMDFNLAALKLRKPPSTIRDAYWSVCRKVGLANKKKGREKPESNPGPISDCSNMRCREAQTPEDFCKKHSAWAEMDQVKSRELLLDNASSIEHAQARPYGSKKRLPAAE